MIEEGRLLHDGTQWHLERRVRLGAVGGFYWQSLITFEFCGLCGSDVKVNVAPKLLVNLVTTRLTCYPGKVMPSSDGILDLPNCDRSASNCSGDWYDPSAADGG